MKHRNLLILLFLAVFELKGYSAENVLIGDLYYNFSGAYALVANPADFWGNIKNTYDKDKYVVPSTITYDGVTYTVIGIDQYAFGGNLNYNNQGSSVSIVILPNTIKEIKQGAFKGCFNLSEIDLGNSVVSIERDAFSNCINLQSLVFPETLETMGSYWGIFNRCDRLREFIYLSRKAPEGWLATSKTYVPDLKSYSKPSGTINNGQIIEMITFRDTEFEYSGKSPTSVWTNNVEGYEASLSMPAISGEVGDHEEWIPVLFTKGSKSFTANVVYRYKVKPAKLKVKVSSASRQYGEENPQFKISYSGFISGENESVLTSQPIASTSATRYSDVGEYPITVSGGYSANYDLEYEPAMLTVTKAPLSAKVIDETFVYGNFYNAFGLEYYGLKNDERQPTWLTKPTFQTDANLYSSVGQYTVRAVNGVALNYDLGEITPGTVSITPAQLTIKANDAARRYYSDDPTFSYKYQGFVNMDDEQALSVKPTISTTATLTSSVGSYPIKVSGASSPNYSISYIDGTLTITPRTLKAYVGNYERLYNEENPAFVVLYDGFVGKDDANSLSIKPVASTEATKTSDVGTYYINVMGGSSDNYEFTYTSGLLTINKAEQTISWDQELTGLKVGDQVELKAEATSGLPIYYRIEDSNNSKAAEIYSSGNKRYLDCKADGEFQIVAIQEGNQNYYSTTRIRKQVVIGNGGTGISSTKGNSIQIQNTSDGVRITNAMPGDLINVYAADGTLQWAVEAENTTTDIQLLKGRVYIIKAGGKTVKVSL